MTTTTTSVNTTAETHEQQGEVTALRSVTVTIFAGKTLKNGLFRRIERKSEIGAGAGKEPALLGNLVVPQYTTPQFEKFEFVAVFALLPPFPPLDLISFFSFNAY